MVKKVVLYVLILCLIILLSSCSEHQTSNGKLTVYAGMHKDHALRAIEVFERETGIKVKLKRLSSGEILDLIRSEINQPQASVWYGGPVDAFIQAQHEGLLYPYISNNAIMIDDKDKDIEGYWTGIYKGALAFVTNKQWLQEIGETAPTSWRDLLEPHYNGKIVTGDPRTSGTAFTVLATVVQLWGEEHGYSYLKILDNYTPQYMSSGEVMGRRVGMKEDGTAIMFAHDAMKYYKEGFRDLIITFPKEGTGYEIGAVAILNGSPDLKEAKLFVDWTLTKEAQELGQHVGNYQTLTNMYAVSPEDSFSLSDLYVISYDHEWAGKNRQRLVNRWVREMIDGH
jgi:iron(III) transport system substrate-binding protein